MRRSIFPSFIIFFLLVPIFVFAHGNKYLEFNPDKSESLKVVDVATPSEAFFAQNDFLGGFDFWIANPGSSGTATFSLLNENETVIGIRTVTVPNISLTSSGTKFHVDLTSQIPVLADKKYKIRITSSMPELRLYYSNRVQVISHNAPFASPYIAGVGLLGSEEQYFSFKYALYESNETSAPIISNVSWSVISTSEMKVDFNANEAVDYRIEYGVGNYGQSSDFFGDYEFCTEGISNCNITVSVSPNQTYQYRLTVKDVWGNQSQQTGTFESGQVQTPTPTPSTSSGPSPTISPTPIPDTIQPAISNLRVTGVTDHSVGIAWTTDEPTDSDLLIKFAGFISVAAVSDPTFELEHFLEIDSGLSPNTSYSARVRSIDSSNNESQASLSFSTLSSSPTPLPTPQQSPQTSPTLTPTSSPQATPIISVSNEGSIEWNSPASAQPTDGYRVDVFDGDGNFIKTIYVPEGNSLQVSDLEEGDYSVIVYENNDGVFKKIDQPVKFKKIKDESLAQRLIKWWPLFIAFFALIGYLLWSHFKRKASQSTQISVS